MSGDFRKGVSLNLEPGCHPAGPSNPYVSDPHSTEVTGLFARGHIWLLMGVLEIQTEALMLAQQVVTHLPNFMVFS